MVPDVNQIMVKGKGIFVNVASKNTKSKLRVLYEVAPVGFIIEKVNYYNHNFTIIIIIIIIISILGWWKIF